MYVILVKSRVRTHTRVRRGKLERIQEFHRRGERKELDRKVSIAKALFKTYVYNQPGDLVKLVKPTRFSGELFRGTETDIGGKRVNYVRSGGELKGRLQPYLKKPFEIKYKSWTNWSTAPKLPSEFSGAAMMKISYNGPVIHLDSVYESIKYILPEIEKQLKAEGDDDDWVGELKSYRRGESKTILLPPINFSLKNIKGRSEYNFYS